MLDTTTIGQAVAEQREELLSTLRTLIRLGAAGEQAVQEYVATRMQELGYGVTRVVGDLQAMQRPAEYVAPDMADLRDRVNIVGTRTGAGTGRSLILYAHADSEPVQHLGGWTRDPFAGELVDGRLYGWGIADDLAGVGAMLATAAILRRLDVALPGDLALVSCLSKRWARGMLAVLSTGLRADGAIYLHPAETGAGMAQVKTATCGLVLLRIEVAGQIPPTREPGHTPFAHLGQNAIGHAARLISRLEALGEARAARHTSPGDSTTHGRATGLLVRHIQGGMATTRVPTQCVFEVAVSFGAAEHPPQVIAEVQAALATCAAADPWLSTHPPQVTVLSTCPALALPANAPLLSALQHACAAFDLPAPGPYPLHVASDIRFPLESGVPTIGYGPRAGNLSQVGGVDEWIHVDDYLRWVAVTTLATLNWCR